MAEHKWDALITGIRRDEDPTRAKERYFSPRNKDSSGITRTSRRSSGTSSPPLGAGRARARAAAARLDASATSGATSSARASRSRRCISPARAGRKKYRFRSLGCWPITKPVESNAATIDDIIDELAITKTSERAGRAQDHHERNAMQKLRAKGFM